ncbi:MAG: hypothetical protein B6242_16220 [Anaerolineaceae bacterium 4572_78]|nr:MAG: hypothetical protein B6242_16220 [Anaerolineaceae bacterium 4572_78]
MNVITIPQSELFIYNLLKNVSDEGTVLRTTKGKQFVLFPFEAWQSFDVGNHDNFESEVKATAEHKDLMTFLASRRSHGKRIPLADVKSMLDL